MVEGSMLEWAYDLRPENSPASSCKRPSVCPGEKGDG